LAAANLSVRRELSEELNDFRALGRSTKITKVEQHYFLCSIGASVERSLLEL
jgi:hypothetical protein